MNTDIFQHREAHRRNVERLKSLLFQEAVLIESAKPEKSYMSQGAIVALILEDRFNAWDVVDESGRCVTMDLPREKERQPQGIEESLGNIREREVDQGELDGKE